MSVLQTGAADLPKTHSEALVVRNGVLVAGGYGVKATVERRYLVVEDGICDERHRTKLARPTAKLRRLVILGHTGFITLEALRWLHDIGATFAQIDADGNVIVLSAPLGLDDARLRRAQALAGLNGVGLHLARMLVRQKLNGQVAVLERLQAGPEAVSIVQRATDGLERARTLDQVRLCEAQAGAAYWGTWESLPVPFASRDARRIPNHWRRFGARTSPITGSPRKAASPANAILNYLYAVLETEARIACLTMGLDPGQGVLHADVPARDSLALDIMETVRPDVDAFVLNALQTHTFRADDFHETREGVCRVLPPLTQALVETAPVWARKVAPVVEQVAQAMGNVARSRPDPVPTLLTQAKRSAGREGQRRRLRRPVEPVPRVLPAACRLCGELLGNPRRHYCDACLPRRERDLRTWQTSGPAALARLVAEGRDPTHGGEVARKRAASLARRQTEADQWERNNQRPNPGEFRRRILPGLKDVPLNRMVRVTGLSVRYCSMIRRGLYVPHPRHWDALRGSLSNR